MLIREGVLALLAVGSLSCAPSPRVSSIYTELSGGNCRLLKENQETGATVHRCRGVAGWDLLVQYDDQRMSLTLVQPDGTERALDLWAIITTGFSSLGPRAEWRVSTGAGERLEPIALIVRVNALDQSAGSGSGRKASYLAVAKLSRATACVTDKVAAGPNANERAREAADRASGAACLSTKQERDKP